MSHRPGPAQNRSNARNIRGNRPDGNGRRSSDYQNPAGSPSSSRAADASNPYGRSQLVYRGPHRSVEGEESATAHSGSRLHGGYNVRQRNFFCRFRVFLILWHENAGPENNQANQAKGITEAQDYVGERIFSKPRRMIVLRSFELYCVCVPIKTYGGRGVTKAGVEPSHHAIAYTREDDDGPSEAEQNKGVDDVMLPSVRVNMDVPTERLDELSRICYSELHTVHFNAKVRPVGMIHQHSKVAFAEGVKRVHIPSIISLVNAAKLTAKAEEDVEDEDDEDEDDEDNEDGEDEEGEEEEDDDEDEE